MLVPRLIPSVVMSLAPVFSSFSGDAPAPIPAEKAEKLALEERVRQLEDRVRELEGLLRQRNAAPAQPAPQDPFAFRNNRGARDIFEQMRREMEQHFGNLDGWSDVDGLNDMLGGFSSNRPRLGVDMRPLSDDLKERYKNDVKEGVFIVSIVPNTPAEHAGLRVGDAVTSFAGKAIKEPTDLQEAVRTAAPGKYDIGVLRRGEALTLQVELGQSEAAPPPVAANRGGWLRRGDTEGSNPGAPNGPRDVRRQSRTEVKASALELSDGLATELKLSDEQKTKMDNVLAQQRQALNDAVSSKTERTNPRRGGMTFHFGGDLNQLVEKHAKDAETQLSGTLSPEQIRQWSDWRKRNSSVSVNQSISIESGPTGGAAGGARPDATGF